MEVLREVVIDTFKLPCHYPANFETLVLDTPSPTMTVSISPQTIVHNAFNDEEEKDAYIFSHPPKQVFKGCAYCCQKTGEIKIVHSDEMIVEVNALLKMMAKDHMDRIAPHRLDVGTCFKINEKYTKDVMAIAKGNKSNMTRMILDDIKFRLNEKIKE